MWEYLVIPALGGLASYYGGAFGVFAAVTLLDAFQVKHAETANKPAIHGFAVGLLSATAVYLTGPGAVYLHVLEVLISMLVVQLLLTPLLGITTAPDGVVHQKRAVYEGDTLRDSYATTPFMGRDVGRAPMGFPGTRIAPALQWTVPIRDRSRHT